MDTGKYGIGNWLPLQSWVRVRDVYGAVRSGFDRANVFTITLLMRNSCFGGPRLRRALKTVPSSRSWPEHRVYILQGE
jgi:hypothetical protein